MNMRSSLVREKQNMEKRELKVRSEYIQNVLMEVVNLPINASNFCSCIIEMHFLETLQKEVG